MMASGAITELSQIVMKYEVVMEKIKILIWSLIQISKVSVFKLAVKALLAFLAAIVPVLVVLQVGRVIDTVILYAEAGEVSFYNNIAPILMLTGLLVAKSFFFYGSGIVTSTVNASLGIRLKRKLADCIKWFPAQSFLDNIFCNEYENASSGIENISDITDNLFVFAGSVVSFFISLTVIARISIWLVIPVMIFFVTGYIMNMSSKKIRHDTWVDQTSGRRYASYLASLFFDRQTAKEIKAYQADRMIIGKWSVLTDQMREERLANDKMSNSFFAYYHVFMDVCGILVLLMAMHICKQGGISAGKIVIAWQLSKGVLLGVQEITESYANIYYENEKIGIAKKFMEKSKDMAYETEKSGTQDQQTAQEKMAFELEDVSFSYQQGKEILHSVNLKIREGETIALFGENGSGKSSLINIMIGLCSPDRGKVLIQGTDAKAVKNGVAGIAFQDFVCYPFSFRENVGFGQVDEIEDDHGIRLASSQGGAEEILERCGMEGLLSKIMEDSGSELSGGEWQRIALSRAYMGQKPLLVYDEPSAKLDPVSELVQFQRLREVFAGRTTILVSHRVGFAKLADRILVLKDGRIVEDGSSETLIQANGEYRRLYNEQAQWYDKMWGQRNEQY